MRPLVFLALAPAAFMLVGLYATGLLARLDTEAAAARYGDGMATNWEVQR